jgi:hypothetical protein
VSHEARTIARLTHLPLSVCRWWEQWCHFAQVYPVYDSSNYCVLSLKLSQSGVPFTVEDIPERPDGIDNSAILVPHRHPYSRPSSPPLSSRSSCQDPIDFYSLREDVKFLYSAHLQLSLGGQVRTRLDFEEFEHQQQLESQHLPPLSLPHPDAISTDSLNNDTSVINGLEELVLSDERGKKVVVMNRIASERSTLTGSDALIEERQSLEGGLDRSCRLFSIIPSGVWNCLRSYYGGGPAIPRLICSLPCSSRSMIEQDEIRSNRETVGEGVGSSDGRGAWVEINPLSLHLFVSDCAGNPLSVPGETIAFRSEGIAAFIFRIISNYVRSSETTSSFPVVDLPDGNVAVKFLEECYSPYLSSSSPSSSTAPLIEDMLRVWFLVYHTALDLNLDESTNQSNSIFTPEEPRGSSISTTPTSSIQNKLMIRHGPLSWWVLDESITSAQLLSDDP